MILSTKKNHQQSKKTYHNKEYVKSSGSLSIHWCSIKKSKSEFAKFKNEKNIQKSFLPVTYISSHHFQKRKKMYSRLLPPPLKKSKTYLLEKRKIPKKILTYFHLCFFCLFFLSNHHTTKQKYFLVSCRNKKLVVN